MNDEELVGPSGRVAYDECVRNRTDGGCAPWRPRRVLFCRPMSASLERFGGLLGQTRSERIHYRCPCGMLYPAIVYRAVNATRDPELAERLRAGVLNAVECTSCGLGADVQVTVVYHDE